MCFSIGQVGITLDCDWKEPVTTGALDRYAAERALQFKLGWFANPIFGNGDYPSVMKQVVARKSREQNFTESRLPAFTDEEKIANKGCHEILNPNNETATLCLFTLYYTIPILTHSRTTPGSYVSAVKAF